MCEGLQKVHRDLLVLDPPEVVYVVEWGYSSGVLQLAGVAGVVHPSELTDPADKGTLV